MKLLKTFLFLILPFAAACQWENTKQNMPSEEKKTNALIHESSPYLLQHAYNPVDWMPWGDEALERAKKENKPLLISIGYSACHWCHVMEHESFEDSRVAALMNAHFICIKVDREERPDIDQIYMDAIQLMTGSGGWPLNCFATPDGKPFYGGTYFPKENWMKILKELDQIYQNDFQKVEDYANQLTAGIRSSNLIEKQDVPNRFGLRPLEIGLSNWSKNFDKTEGGNNYAPKFPMPNNQLLLLRYAHLQEDDFIKKQVLLNLEKMAFGGIYDQIGGGFTRYATDMDWKVPHFEKMLYDNAQLIRLYSEAYRYEKNILYKDIVRQSIDFLKRELKDESGIYYSALDADSEGEEGKYYVWKIEELKSLLGEDFELAKAHFNFNEIGLWEHGNYIPLRKEQDAVLAAKFQVGLDEYRLTIERIREKLLVQRTKRIRPGLDDKSLCSWNALLVRGFIESYISFRDPNDLEEATAIAQFILKNYQASDGRLNHSYKNGKSSINGYLEDYAFSIEAFLSLYEQSFDEQWILEAKKLADYCIDHFQDSSSGLFYFTSDLDPELIARKMEMADNVIPASNSSLALGLHKLGSLLDEKRYLNLSEQMLSNAAAGMQKQLPAYSNWAMLLLKRSKPYYEIAIVGEKALEKKRILEKQYLPNAVFLGASESSSLPLLEGKFVPGQTRIYVCEQKVCQLPTDDPKKALELIKLY